MRRNSKILELTNKWFRSRVNMFDTFFWVLCHGKKTPKTQASSGLLPRSSPGHRRQADLSLLFSGKLLGPSAVLAVTLSERGAARLYRQDNFQQAIVCWLYCVWTTFGRGENSRIRLSYAFKLLHRELKERFGPRLKLRWFCGKMKCLPTVYLTCFRWHVWV